MSGADLAKDLDLAEFARFRDYIHQHSGIFLEEIKLDSLRISLVTRATRFGYNSYEDYFHHLISDETEFKELMNLVTINETSFFRFPQQFEALREHVLPEIMQNKISSQHSLRVWSAGCSTGEEPYSLAMTLSDMNLDLTGWRTQVLGTDVSTQALDLAKAGVYGRKAMLNVPDAVIDRHFVRRPEERFEVTPRVRGLVDFGYHNLIKEPYPLSLMGNWDVIFCRNVTIYFKVESTRRVVSNFFSSLNEGGYLFIGHSETLTSISSDFEPVEVGGVFLYRKPKRRAVFGVFDKVGLAGGASVAGSAPSADAGDLTGARERMQKAREEMRARRRTTSIAERAEEAAAAAAEAGALIDKARRLITEGRPGEVHGVVERILEVDPGSVDAHLLSAYAYADEGRLDEALAACHRAVAVNPLVPAARYILGIIHQRQGDTVGAVSEFKKTIYIDPEFALAHLNLGNIYRTQGRWDAAAREYENAIKALEGGAKGEWAMFMGGFEPELLVQTCQRSLLECRKAMGIA